MELIICFLDNMEVAPIALFVYNRLDHTKATVAALQKNELASESDLFIFSDGPKSARDEKMVQHVRAFVETVQGFKSVTIIKSTVNKGLASSLIQGVNMVIAEKEKIIVLEDDIVTSPFFLTYMNRALDIYEQDNQIMHVNGYFFAHNTPLPNYFFTSFMLCWGWGTWKSAWNYFSDDFDTHIDTLSLYLKKNNYLHVRNALSTLRANKAGKVSTWAASWQASILTQDGLCITPSISYAKNIGHDGSGENATSSKLFDTLLSQSYIEIGRSLPMREEEEALRISNAVLEESRGSLLKRIIRRLTRMI